MLLRIVVIMSWVGKKAECDDGVEVIILVRVVVRFWRIGVSCG